MINSVEERLERIEKRMIEIEKRQIELIELVQRLSNHHTRFGSQHSFPVIN